MAIARYGFEPKHGGFRNEESDESDTESDDSAQVGGNTFDSKSKAKLDMKNKPRNKFNDNYKWWLKDNNMASIGQKELEFQREPRWPTEMQVLPEKIKHVQWAPGGPEPFYKSSKVPNKKKKLALNFHNFKSIFENNLAGLEEMPMARTESQYKTVYYYNPISCGYVRKNISLRY
jgi:hypothetical protein